MTQLAKCLLYGHMNPSGNPSIHAEAIHSSMCLQSELWGSEDKRITEAHGTASFSFNKKTYPKRYCRRAMEKDKLTLTTGLHMCLPMHTHGVGAGRINCKCTLRQQIGKTLVFVRTFSGEAVGETRHSGCCWKRCKII